MPMVRWAQRLSLVATKASFDPVAFIPQILVAFGITGHSRLSGINPLPPKLAKAVNCIDVQH